MPSGKNNQDRADEGKMTTIIYDACEHKMYADTGVEVGDHRVAIHEKITRGYTFSGEPFLLGFAGEAGAENGFIHWLETGEAIKVDRKKNFQAIVVVPDGVYEHVNSSTPSKCDQSNRFFCIGSGMFAALGALAVSGDPKLALKAAIKLDCYSAAPIRIKTYPHANWTATAYIKAGRK